MLHITKIRCEIQRLPPPYITLGTPNRRGGNLLPTHLLFCFIQKPMDTHHMCSHHLLDSSGVREQVRACILWGRSWVWTASLWIFRHQWVLRRHHTLRSVLHYFGAFGWRTESILPFKLVFYVNPFVFSCRFSMRPSSMVFATQPHIFPTPTLMPFQLLWSFTLLAGSCR